MKLKRVAIFIFVVLFVGTVCFGCSSGGPVSVVKSFTKAFVKGEPRKINAYLSEDIRIKDEDSNIWEYIVENAPLEAGVDDYKSAMIQIIESAEFELLDKDAESATVKVSMNLKRASTMIIDAVEDEDRKAEMQEDFDKMDDEDFIDSATFELEKIGGKWLITKTEGWDYLYES